MQVENEPPPEVASAASARLPSGGNGLVGMKERVAGRNAHSLRHRPVILNGPAVRWPGLST